LNIFLSYASPYRELADDLCCRLQAVGHEVFFDREDLPAGTSFDDRIRQAIDDAELFIFLVAPESVAQGHYTRTELKLAARKWPTPGWHVLPVMVAETPLADVPAYLRALTLMQAEGNLTAEVVMEVEDRVRQHGPATVEPATPAKRDSSAVRYRSLQLRFADGAPGSYALSVPDSPAGALADTAIQLDAATLEQALWSNARPITGSARRAGPAEAEPALLPGDAAARQIGQTLYAAVFGSSAGGGLEDSLRGIDPQRGDGLRFVINTTDAPDLARLPWEFLYSPKQDDFLFSDRLKPVVRWLDVDEPPPTLAVEPPLRMLMAISAPADRPELAIGHELAQLDSALAELSQSGVLTTVRLEHTSLESLDQALLKHRPHVLHFIGHGDFVGDDGVLVLESDQRPGSADTIAGRQLAVLLRNYRDCLRLVFLNSCMGATASTRDPFSGVAQSLIRRGIPAVIAMQFPVPDEAAVALSRHFYRYLAAGQPVDAALSSARAFLYARGYLVEWGAPALYMRAPDGRLFDLAPAPAAERMAPPTAMPPSAAPAPVGAPPDTAPASKSKALPLILIGLVLAGAVGAWLFWPAAAPVTDTVPDVVNPAPPIEAPVIVEAPSAEETVDALIADLDAARSTPAMAELRAILEGSDAEARALVLGERNVDIRNALRRAEARADARGDRATADELAALRAAITPRETAGIEAPPTSVEAAIATLGGASTGMDVQTAIARLTAVLKDDPAALSPERLGNDHEALINGLVSHAQTALMAGDTPTYEAALALLQGLAPSVDWAQQIDALAAGAIEPAAGDGGTPPGYVVRRGDSLWSIAKRFLGSGTAWPRLVEQHNAKASVGMGGKPIEHPDRIRPGQWIHLPATSSIGLNTIEYHVQPGDTLSGIAWRVGGDARLWPQILHDNADRITDPDRIRPGQILTIRPRPPLRPF
jgi:nucleoid-associated protein YgaU